MLLAIDVGNTNVTLGLFEKTKLKHHWCFDSDKARLPEDLTSVFQHFWKAERISVKKVGGIVVSNVVPFLATNLLFLCQNLFQTKPLWVTHETSGMPLRVDDPKEVGADRLCNAVAVWEKWKQATIVVDFGTATTLDIVTAKGEYGGGAIVPGIEVSNINLARAAAQIPRVEVVKPKRVVGRNTIECLQAGLYYGYIGMVDYLVQLSIREEGGPMKVVATGGLAPLLAAESETIKSVEPHLTLEGLRLIWSRNH